METLIVAVISALIGGGGVAGVIKLIVDPRQEKKREEEAAKNAKQAHRKELGTRVLEHLRIHRSDLDFILTLYENQLGRIFIPFNQNLIPYWLSKHIEQQKEMANLASELLLDSDAKEVYDAVIAWARASDAYGKEIMKNTNFLHKSDPKTLEDLDREINTKVEAVEATVHAYLSK